MAFENKAEIICVGTELLLGDIVNTNGAFLARELAELGVNLYRQTVVGDNPGRLKAALEEAFSRSAVVITTGGLGPTCDDLTKETVADFFGREMELHQPSLDRILDYFARTGREVTENNRKQAMMPRGAVVLENRNGTAPGAIVEDGQRAAILLPGPPREMEPMFRSGAAPWLRRQFSGVLLSHRIHFYGIGESALESQLRCRMERMTNPTLAPYAKEGEVMLRLTARAATREEAQALMEPVLQELLERYPREIYGVDVGDLQTAAVQALARGGLTAAAAESCTGGYIAKRLTDVPGSSAVFRYGAVTYSNEAKERILGVRRETLEAYTAVSRETAREMARGMRRLSGADIAVASTGYAGPGDAPGQETGLVWIAVDSPRGTRTQELHLGRGGDGERERIRLLASSRALFLLLREAQALSGER